MNNQLIREKIDVMKQAQNYTNALRLAVKLHDVEPSDALATEITLLRELVDLEIEKAHKAKIAFLTRKALVVNQVNDTAMRLAEKITAFVRENGIDKKADNTLTKRYETKLKAVLSEVQTTADWFLEVPRYSLEGFYLNVRMNYRNQNDQNSTRYDVQEYFSLTLCAESVKPAQRPTDRTAEFYLACEKELAEKSAQLNDLQCEVSRLKAIAQE